ncbi:MAG: hypothetical protein HY319_22030 [Armatimonadetes bacterium]|nr:hypothetical protein [Armatimonadota bacterium]
MFFLAPSIAHVLEAAERYSGGHLSADQLKATLPEAVSFVQDSGHLYRTLSAGILRTETVEELLNQARLELEAQAEALQKVELAAEEGRVHAVREWSQKLRASSERLLELYGKLQEEERKEKVYSPFPELDHFIKTGINLLNGFLEPLAVQNRIPTLMGLAGKLRADVDRFRALHGALEVADRAAGPLDRIAAGVGACIAFVQEGRREALQDGLKLLGSGSVQLAEVLQEFDRVAAGHQQYSSHRPLEELARALTAHREDRVPPELVDQTWAAVDAAFHYYDREVRSVRSFSLFPALEEDWKPVSEAVERLRQKLEPLAEVVRSRPRLESFPLAELDAAFSAVVSGTESLWQRLDNEVKKLQGAPHLEALRDMIGRAIQGNVPRRELREGLEHFKRLQAELLSDLGRSRDAGTQQLAALLATHTAGFDLMERYFEDEDPGHLRRGWAFIEQSLPRLIEIGQEMKERVEAQRAPEEGPRQVLCFRCGASNTPGRRYCASCNAMLPATLETPVEYTDIIGGQEDEQGFQPANLVRLEQLAERVEAGDCSRGELARELDQLLAQADQTRRMFEKQLVPMLGSDAVLTSYATFFAQALAQFVEGLLTMRGFAEEGSLNLLRSGLVMALEAGEQLDLMRHKIDQAIRGD